MNNLSKTELLALIKDHQRTIRAHTATIDAIQKELLSRDRAISSNFNHLPPIDLSRDQSDAINVRCLSKRFFTYELLSVKIDHIRRTAAVFYIDEVDLGELKSKCEEVDYSTVCDIMRHTPHTPTD